MRINISETQDAINKELAFMKSMSETPCFNAQEAQDTLDKLASVI